MVGDKNQVAFWLGQELCCLQYLKTCAQVALVVLLLILLESCFTRHWPTQLQVHRAGPMPCGAMLEPEAKEKICSTDLIFV